MLISLEIKNFAVISHAYFEPSAGLNVITGETGAGKSLLVDALGLIMGDKASRNIIRSDSDNAYVEAVFDISDMSDDQLNDFLKESDIDPEEGRLIISRKINNDGKSSARVNGKTVVLATLRHLTSFLIDIHGQNDTQIIFDESKNCDLLFAYGGSEVKALKDKYDTILSEYKDIVLKIRNLSKSPEMLQKRKEYLEFAVSEIDEAELKPGIEEELLSLKRKMAKGEKISDSLSSVRDSLDDDPDNRSIMSLLSYDVSAIGKIRNEDDRISDIDDRLSSVLLDLQAIRDDVDNILSDLDYDQTIKDQTDRKISLIYDLKSKYGSSVEEILEFRDKARREIDSFDDDKDQLIRLKHECQEVKDSLVNAANELSDVLFVKARELEENICRQLSDLEMPEARFRVDFTERPKERFFSSHGIYDIRFMFTANPGQDLKPLSSIVSGGEASRIMLAVRNILSECDSIPTLVFDEIDMGVSGKASTAIAYKLKSIGFCHQVLCVSHTSQICAAADNNYLLTKKVFSNSTEAEITRLDNDAKIIEVSRLLSGKDDEESVNLAKNLIDQFSVAE